MLALDSRTHHFQASLAYLLLDRVPQLPNDLHATYHPKHNHNKHNDRQTFALLLRAAIYSASCSITLQFLEI
jgi:hypothetical protein